jgi:hypothetical protein
MKYVTFWEMDMSKFPADPKERTGVMMKLVEMTKQWKKDHPDSDWGSFIGEFKGFSTSTGSPQDMMKINLMFAPYVQFKVFQAASIDEVEELMKSMTQMQPK